MARVIPLNESARRDFRLEELVREQGRKLKNLIIRMVGPADAEDLLQETFLRICQALPTFRSEATLSTWAYRIAVNVCLDFLSRNRRRAKVALTVGLDSVEESELALPSRLISPESAAENQALSLVLRQGLLMLHPDLRAVLVLRDVEGLSYKELAQILHLPVGTVQSRLHKARAKLRDIIRPQLEGE